MKKKILFLVLVVSILLGIYFVFINKKNSTSVGEANNQIVGNDKDIHGCIGSAGYQFSILRAGCIRVFEAGVRLDPKDDKLDQTTSAYIVFKDMTDSKDVELFLPGQKDSILMTLKSGSWNDSDGKYKLVHAGNSFLLLDSGMVLLYSTGEIK